MEQSFATVAIGRCQDSEQNKSALSQSGPINARRHPSVSRIHVRELVIAACDFKQKEGAHVVIVCAAYAAVTKSGVKRVIRRVALCNAYPRDMQMINIQLVALRVSPYRM